MAQFKKEDCQTYPNSQICPAKPGKHDPPWHLRFTQAQVKVSRRLRRSQIHLQGGRNLRAWVEFTVRQVKHPFTVGKLLVRSQVRITCLVIGSAIMSNIRRVQRYEAIKDTQNNENSTKMRWKSTPSSPFVSTLLNVVLSFLSTFALDNRVFGF